MMLTKIRIQLCKMIMDLGKEEFPEKRELMKKIDELHGYIADIQLNRNINLEIQKQNDLDFNKLVSEIIS